MKLVIASDIHGSAYYCGKLMDRYNAENADKLILLGDILYHGPRNDLPKDYAPKKVISMLNEIKEDILCVRGNCDSEVDQMVLQFPILADYALMYWKNKLVFITHGHTLNLQNMPMIKKGDILLHGHTHVPACEKTDICTYVNPGSVSIPKENSRHSYIVMDTDSITFKNLDGEEYKKVTYEEL